MNMPEIFNLSKAMKEQLPEGMVAFIKHAGDTAEKLQQRLYLVGGIVRDLLLERGNTDLDLVTEGDAIKLAREIAIPIQARVVAHPRFGTANLKLANWSIDFVSARAETYYHPGALPTVKPGVIRDDLARRDFTINAMAVELHPLHFGEVIDPFGGRQDLDKRLIRVLHEKSFIDDATRIWRAIRYEQRLDFKIEPDTLSLIKRDINMLKTISGDRIRHELELILTEEEPEKAIIRAAGLGALAMLHPALRADDWLAETFATARERNLPDAVQTQLYLSLLCYRMDAKELEQLIEFLRFPKVTAQVLQDTLAIKSKIKELAEPGLAPSVIYGLLHDYSPTAYTVNSIGADSSTAAEHIDLYLNVLRHVKPALSGEDLVKLGVSKGPRIKEVLLKLREARLDGKIISKKGEEDMVREWSG